MQKYILIILLFCCYNVYATASNRQNYDKITPNEVYEQLYIINEEIKLLKQFFNVEKQIEPFEIRIELYPRHMWQKTYEVMVKINLLREKHNLPYLAVPSREPRKDPAPSIVYGQLLRIITEIRIIKFTLEIPNIDFPEKKFTNTQVTDSFNFISNISAEIDLLLGVAFTPSFVFSQTMRISEDIDSILNALNISDETIPPPKKADATPHEAYETAEKLMLEIVRIQRVIDVASIDFSALKPEKITPSDVFSMTGIILAELQTIKGHLGLKYTLTPTALRYSNMTPGDVEQILGWCVRKTQLIDSIK